VNHIPYRTPIFAMMAAKTTCLVTFMLICFTLFGQGKTVTAKRVAMLDSVQYGIASFYADKFEGKRMANGEIFQQKGMTCAHNSLPLGTIVKITNLRNEKYVVVRVTDRLHHRNMRLVDLSRSAAEALEYIKRGLTRVKLEIIELKSF
jgi:rare lipoprotein A